MHSDSQDKKRIAVLTSGGDAPGMNAAIRAAVRRGLVLGAEVWGVFGGYRGLIKNEMERLNSRSVSNIVQRGGTFLKTARSEEFRTPEGVAKAVERLEYHKIDGLVVVGGDGSYRGLIDLLKVWNGKGVGVPGTIDNDLYGTFATIGFDTAVNTALEAIDRIRDTADAHERFFVVEVMGRHAGFIALSVGIGGGAEDILVPEHPCDLNEVAKRLHEGKQRGKLSSIIVVAEGYQEGGAEAVADKLKKLSGCECRVVVLGHIQRGGTPTARDRELATRLGCFAVDCLLEGKSGVAVGVASGGSVTTPLEDAVSKRKAIDPYLYSIVHSLSHA